MEIINETKQMLDEARQLAAVTKSISVVSYEDYLLAGENFKEVGQKIKLVKEKFKPAKDAAFAAHKKVCALEAEIIGPYEEAQSFLKNKIISWDREQKRLEEERAAQARREAEELARQENERLKKEAEERDRKEKEEKAALAERLKAAGFEEEAKEIEEIVEKPFEEPAQVPVIIPPPVEKLERVSGIAIRTKYVAKVVDFKALIQAVAEGKLPSIALLPNQKFLDEQANSFKKEFRMDGCVAEEIATAARTGR